MRAVVFPRIGEMQITQVPTPSPGPGEVLVRVEASGLCGTDKHIFSGKYAATFQPDIDVRRCRFVWLGTHKLFEAFTFAFEETEHGWFQA